jgi:FkbM family methyltransferase
VFFDIGANIGTYSWNALDAGIKDIYLFEPDPTNQRLVSKTISNNIIKNAFLFPIALGKNVELALFLIDEVSGAAGTLNEQNNPKSIQLAYDLSQYRKIPV